MQSRRRLTDETRQSRCQRDLVGSAKTTPNDFGLHELARSCGDRSNNVAVGLSNFSTPSRYQEAVNLQV